MPADKPTAEPSREALTVVSQLSMDQCIHDEDSYAIHCTGCIALLLDGLLRDRRRLDWLEKIGAYPVYGYGDAAGNPLSVRAAIDAAMEAEDE